ncbi:MAG TPA: hypothetical protein VHC67_14875 [Gaiellaceae bacterium]|nr:hypothetical protein [Gaiellaceae bacterium]
MGTSTYPVAWRWHDGELSLGRLAIGRHGVLLNSTSESRFVCFDPADVRGIVLTREEGASPTLSVSLGGRGWLSIHALERGSVFEIADVLCHLPVG